MRRNTIMTMLTVAAVSLAAHAQEAPGLLGGPEQDFMENADNDFRGARRGGQNANRMTAEEAADVWSAQAASVARRLDLDAAQSGQLTQAYLAQRQSLHEAMQEIQAQRRETRGDRADKQRGARGKGKGDRAVDGESRGRGQGQRGQGQRGRRAGMSDEHRALIDANRAEFETTLGAFLNETQVTSAVETLGRPNRAWDQMVRQVNGFELDASSRNAALASIESYVQKTADVRGMRGGGDRELMMAAMTEARETLRSELEGMLTDEQLETFASSLEPRGRGGARGERGERRGRAMDRFDTNGDGKIQRDELPEPMQDRFDELDANGDGSIDESEMSAMRRSRGGQGRGQLQ